MKSPEQTAEYNLLATLFYYSQDAIPKISENIFYYDDAKNVFLALKEQQASGAQLDFLLAAQKANVKPYDATGMLDCGFRDNSSVWEFVVKSNYLNRRQNQIWQESKAYTDGLDRIQFVRRELEKAEQVVGGVDISQDSYTMFRDSMLLESPIIPTKFPIFDRWFGGWEKGDFVLIAARPSVGKTAFGCSLAWNMARYGNIGVDYHSYEMQGYRVRRRVIASIAKVENKRIRFPKSLEADEFNRCLAANDEIEKYPIRFLGSSGVNVAALVNEIHRTKSDVVLIDYLGCVPASINGSKKDQIGDVSNKLRDAAKKSGKVVLSLVQMNRDVEHRKSEPVLADLRDSGELEQDADIVLFLHEPDRRENMEHGSPVVDMKVIGEKMRDGEVGWKSLKFDKRYSHFYEESDRMPDVDVRYEARLNF